MTVPRVRAVMTGWGAARGAVRAGPKEAPGGFPGPLAQSGWWVHKVCFIISHYNEPFKHFSLCVNHITKKKKKEQG